MGILTEYVDIFERRAQGAVRDIIQGDIYDEFKEQVGAGRYERNATRQDFSKGRIRKVPDNNFWNF